MSEKRPIRKSGITAKNIGSETLLYGAGDKAIHVLNPTAHLVWELCDGAHTVADMERAVRERFAVPEGRDLRADIEQTLQVFAAKGLLDVAGHD